MLTVSRKVILHVDWLVADYLIQSPAYPPTALSSMIFVSEVSGQWEHDNPEIERVTNNAIITQLLNLEHLETLYILDAEWLAKSHMETILLGCPHLKDVNLNGSDRNFFYDEDYEYGGLLPDDINGH